MQKFAQLRKFSSQSKWFKPVGRDETAIRIFNCAAKRPVPLVLNNDSYTTWYTCGPTVYDSAHLGHASCYVKLDIIQRILRQYFDLNLVTAMNITDIDDKIIRKSEETGRHWQELARQYESEFWSDMRKLNVKEPNIKLRVTENMPKIFAFIESIIAKGGAYVTQDGSVYFAVKKFPLYGKLQNVNLEETRNELVEHKHDATDFALWKSRKNETEPAWESPWGAGRPGWHIECSALASMAFGGSIDFHAGGLDLRFPHHENEEAQSCVFHNRQQWVNYWIHTGQLHVSGQQEKMSKSLKNTISIDEMLSKYSADDFRMACLLSNYKNSMEYSDAIMSTAQNTLNRFKAFRADCQAYLSGKKQGSDLNAAQMLKHIHFNQMEINACLRDDFNTAGIVTLLLDQVSSTSSSINANHTSNLISASCLDGVAAVANYVERTLGTFGFAFVEGAQAEREAAKQEVDLHGLLEDLLNSRKIIRERAVAAKNNDLFKICDELRNCLKQHGIEIRDHNLGSSWNFVGTKLK